MQKHKIKNAGASVNSNGTVRKNMNVSNSMLPAKSYRVNAPEKPLEDHGDEHIIPMSSTNSSGVDMNNTKKDTKIDSDGTVRENMNVSDSMLSSKSYQVDASEKPLEDHGNEPIIPMSSTNSSGVDMSNTIKIDTKIDSDGTVRENMNVSDSMLSSKSYRVDTPKKTLEDHGDEPIIPISSTNSNKIDINEDIKKDVAIDVAGNEPIIPTGSTNSSGADISDDIEKDINIDVAINNNSACSITHNSTITISYYNFESEGDAKKPQREGMSLYCVWLPKPYVNALEKLSTASGSNPSQLAEEAYNPLMKQFGIPLGETCIKSDERISD